MSNNFGICAGKAGIYIRIPPQPMRRFTRYEAAELAAWLLVVACDGDLDQPIVKERRDREANANGPDAPTFNQILQDVMNT